MSRIVALDGIPIENAKRPLTITITEKDIKKADSQKPDSCAAAIACLREGAAEARVHLSRVYLKAKRGLWKRYATPAALRIEIVAFDRSGRFAPGEYILATIQPSHRPVGKRLGGPGSGSKSAKRRRRGHHVLTDVRTGPVSFAT